MRKITTAMLLLCLSVSVHATNYKPKPKGDCNGVHNCNSYTDNSEINSARSAAEAKSKSQAESSSNSAAKVYGSGNSRNYNDLEQKQKQRTDVNASSSNKNSNDLYIGGSREYEYEYESNYSDDDTTFNDGDTQTETSTSTDVAVDGDHYSNYVKYETAANRAVLIVGDCQEGTDLSSIKFGIALIKDDPACFFFRQAAAQYLLAASMDCGDFTQSVIKGAATRPNPTQCLRKRAELFENAEGIEAEGLALLRAKSKQGFLKKAWRFIW